MQIASSATAAPHLLLFIVSRACCLCSHCNVLTGRGRRQCWCASPKTEVERRVQLGAGKLLGHGELVLGWVLLFCAHPPGLRENNLRSTCSASCQTSGSRRLHRHDACVRYISIVGTIANAGGTSQVDNGALTKFSNTSSHSTLLEPPSFKTMYLFWGKVSVPNSLRRPLGKSMYMTGC